MSLLSWIEEKDQVKVQKPVSKKDVNTRGLWARCDQCGAVLYVKHLKANQRICFSCGHHFQMNCKERIKSLIDPDTWCPLNEILSPCNPIEFYDYKSYYERLTETQKRTKLQDAILTGTGLLDGFPVALGVMDFNFMGGSMGSVVGEKITRLIEYATCNGLPLVLFCASGGARMQEGIFSLMQMAKIAAALKVYRSSLNLFYISVLTSPTMGGVTASFAMLGDLVLAEPDALIGFAGRRVIEQTIQEILPDQFQTAEYLLEHGFLNLIIQRSFLKQALSEILTIYHETPLRRQGEVQMNIQNNFSFLTEEIVRRKLNVQNKINQDDFDFLKNEETQVNRLIYEASSKYADAFENEDEDEDEDEDKDEDKDKDKDKDKESSTQFSIPKNDCSDIYQEILTSLSLLLDQDDDN